MKINNQNLKITNARISSTTHSSHHCPFSFSTQTSLHMSISSSCIFHVFHTLIFDAIIEIENSLKIFHISDFYFSKKKKKNSFPKILHIPPLYKSQFKSSFPPRDSISKPSTIPQHNNATRFRTHNIIKRHTTRMYQQQ